LVLVLFNSLLASEYKVAIFDYDVPHPREQTVSKYIQVKLMESGLPFSHINLFSGENQDKVAVKVLRELENDNYDLIITVTSDALSAAEYRLKNTPWLFTNVNNPKFFGHRYNKYSSQHSSGVSYYVKSIEQLKFFNELMNGKLKKVGLIFDYSAKSRRVEIFDFAQASNRLKIERIIKVIKTKEELPLIVKNMIESEVDAIVLTSSNKLYENIDLILQQSNKYKIPIFSVNKKGVANGALTALANDYYKMVDNNLIPMVVDVLKNKKDPGSIPVQTLSKPMIYLNLTQAKILGLKISNKIKHSATKVY